MVVVPLIAGWLASLVTRQKHHVFALFGAGYLGNLLASSMRHVTRIDPVAALGILDPLLWMFVGSVAIMAASRAVEKLWEWKRKESA